MAAPTAYRLTCKGIKLDNKDGMFRKSDPYVHIVTGDRKVVGKSNVVDNNLNPEWQPFVVDVASCGGMTAPLELRVYDYDADGTHDFIGGFATTLQNLVTNVNSQIPLINPDKHGMFAKKESGKFVVVRAEPLVIQAAHAYNVVFNATKLSNKDGLLGKSDPFLVLERVLLTPIGDRVKKEHIFVAMTDKIDNNLNPTWPTLMLNTAACGGMDQQLRLSVYDFDADGTHDLIGRCYSTLREITLGSPQRWPLIDPFKAGGMGYNNSGELHVKSSEGTQVDPIDSTIESFQVIFKGEKFANKDFLGKSDPVFKIFLSNGKLLYQSEVINNNLNPVWAQFTLSVEECGGLDGNLLLQFEDSDTVTRSDIIGYCRATLRKLWVSQQRNIKLLLRNKKQMAQGSNHGSGRLIVQQMQTKIRAAGAAAPPSTTAPPTAAAGAGAAAPPYGTGYPPAAGGYGAPPYGTGYPPAAGGYGAPPYGTGYPPAAAGGYGAPPYGTGYPPAAAGGAAPPYGTGYPPAPYGTGYPPPAGGAAPPYGTGYPPPAGGAAPPYGTGYPPPAGGAPGYGAPPPGGYPGAYPGAAPYGTGYPPPAGYGAPPPQ